MCRLLIIGHGMRKAHLGYDRWPGLPPLKAIRRQLRLIGRLGGSIMPSAANLSIDEFATQVPRLAVEPH
jgi:hypothetical protein